MAQFSPSICRSTGRPCSEIPILLVDLDEPFRAGLAQMLRDDAHEVLDFATPADVPPLEGLHRVGLVITEYLLPGEHGIAFADRFHRIHPRMPILLVSIYLRGSIDARVGGREFVHAVGKPIEYDRFHEHVHQLVR